MGSNIWLGWKWLTLTYTWAYFKTKLITDIKCLTVDASGVIMLFCASEICQIETFCLGSVSGSNIRLGWKWLTLTNTLAYYKTKLIMDVKCLIVDASCVIMLFGSSQKC